MKQLVAALIVMLTVSVLPVAAQDDPPISPQLEARMNELEAQTREIRRLDGTTVERAFPSRDETMLYLSDQFDAQLPLDEVQRYTDFYVAFDLLEPGIDLREVYLELLESQVAGFYDSDTGVMHVVALSGEIGDELSFLEEIIYVHEYQHALQDQNFGLDALIDNPDTADEPDRLLASVSLVEGDATAVMLVFVQEAARRDPLAVLGVLGDLASVGMLQLPPDTPGILVRELTYPYEGGMAFVLALVQEAGWPGVDAAFANPPTSTEQILHPEKYMEGEEPIPVSLADSAASLGGSWTRIWDATLGEWYLAEHLRTQLGVNDANEAAAGWGGDRFHIYRDESTGDLAWVMRIVWDTPDEAAEFADAYREFGDSRFETAAVDGCWSGPADSLCLLPGAEDTRIALAPTVEQARALLAARS